MSNPTFVQGPITFEAGAPLEKFTLVDIDAEGHVVPSAGVNPFGAVTEKADPDSALLPTDIAVHYGPSAVKLVVDKGEDASEIKAGSPIYASIVGLVTAKPDERYSTFVGIAVRDGSDGKVLTVLTGLPAVAAAPADEAEAGEE